MRSLADGRIWELSVAVQVGSGLEEKEVVSEQLVHVGHASCVLCRDETDGVAWKCRS